MPSFLGVRTLFRPLAYISIGEGSTEHFVPAKRIDKFVQRARSEAEKSASCPRNLLQIQDSRQIGRRRNFAPRPAWNSPAAASYSERMERLRRRSCWTRSILKACRLAKYRQAKTRPCASSLPKWRAVKEPVSSAAEL